MTQALPDDLREAAAAVARRLRARFGPRIRVIRLFGSWARRQPHEHSDLDLAVIIDDLTRAEWREAIDEIAQIELDCEVDIGAFVTSSRRFDELLRRRRKIAMNIENEGITL